MPRRSSCQSSSGARCDGSSGAATGASGSRSTDASAPPTRWWSRRGRSRGRTYRSSPRGSVPRSSRRTPSATGDRARCRRGPCSFSAAHKVVLSIGSRQKPLPQRVLGRDLFWWLTKARILDATVESRLGRKLSTRDTLIGSSPGDLTKRHGIELKPRLVDVDGRRARFEDGSELAVDAVVWATGYRPDYSWVRLPVFAEDGRL